MSEQLFPVFDVPDLVTEDETMESRNRTSVLWDIEKGDFARDGASKLIKCNEREAFQSWCYKMIFTEKFTHLAYNQEIGVEMENAMSQISRITVETYIQRTIVEALLVNPLTESVEDFYFEWDSDCVFCEFTVKGIDLEEFDIQVNIRKGEVNIND